MRVTEIFDVMARARVFDLGQPYFVGMPHYPTHPPFLFGLTHEHTVTDGVSSASDALAMSGHTGTHLDALCHFSRDGRLHGGAAIGDAQSFAGGIAELSVATVGPIVRRGVLLDLARLEGVEMLEPDFAVTPERMEAAVRAEGVKVEAGDVVLLRTGRDARWEDPPRYFEGGRAPGPDEAGARWLSERKVFAAGSDTMSFERVPSPGMPVHAHLLVDSGIHILECLNLRELAHDRVYTFLFVGAPLKIRGGTGGPIRPLALAL
jgi:kynurenine formamidase